MIESILWGVVGGIFGGFVGTAAVATISVLFMSNEDVQRTADWLRGNDHPLLLGAFIWLCRIRRNVRRLFVVVTQDDYAHDTATVVCESRITRDDLPEEVRAQLDRDDVVVSDVSNDLTLAFT